MAIKTRNPKPDVTSLDPSNKVSARQVPVLNTHKASGANTRDANGNNCCVLSPTDASHVRMITPLEIKFKDVQSQVAATEPHERMQEIENAIRRHNASVRPLGGIK